MSEKRYTLEITETQLRLLVEALEVATRLLMGQFSYLRSFFLYLWPRKSELPVNGWEELETLLASLKAMFFPNEPYNGGPGIRSDKLPNRVRILYDLLQVVSQSSKKWGSVLKTSDHELAKLKEVENADTGSTD